MNTPDSYFLKSARLGFRRWCHSDLYLAEALWGDSRVTQHIDARGTLTRGQIRERLQNEILSERRYGVQYWPIFLLISHEHIGCCGLKPYDLSHNLYELGFHIRPAHWRRGYAFEAAQAVIRYAFNENKAESLFAGHHPKNESSRRLLQKLGFRYTHSEFYAPTGLRHPSYILNVNPHF